LKLKTVKKDSEIVNLKLKEYQVLEYILKNKTVTRTDLIDYIWGSEDVLY
jgi:DNA-binding response OmpR family regulator